MEFGRGRLSFRLRQAVEQTKEDVFRLAPSERLVGRARDEHGGFDQRTQHDVGEKLGGTGRGAAHLSMRHRLLDGLLEHAQAIARIQLAPALPAEDGRGVDEKHALQPRRSRQDQKPLHPQPQRRHGVLRRPGGRADLPVQALHGRLGHGLEQTLLAVVMVVQRAARHPRGCDNLLRADGLKSVRFEACARHPLQGGPGVRGIFRFPVHIHTVCIFRFEPIGQPVMTMNHVEMRERTQLIPGLNVRTRVLDAGRGPVVLLLHGNPDNADEWRLLIERLAATHRCIAPDFPGYGQSPEPPPTFDYSLEVQRRFVDAVLDAMDVSGPLVLVVHDTGGMVGTAWAAANVARLRGVVFTNTVAYEGFEWFPIARRWGNASLLGRFRAALGMRVLGFRKGAIFKRIFGAQSPLLSAAQLDRMAAAFALNPVAKRTTLRQFRQFIRPEFFRGFEEMRRRLITQVPCRVLWGDQDPYLPVSCAERFEGAHVTVLPKAGHWVPLVAANQLAAEVEALG